MAMEDVDSNQSTTETTRSVHGRRAPGRSRVRDVDWMEIERARRLAADPGYPSKEIIDQMAARIISTLDV